MESGREDGIYQHKEEERRRNDDDEKGTGEGGGGAEVGGGGRGAPLASTSARISLRAAASASAPALTWLLSPPLPSSSFPLEVELWGLHGVQSLPPDKFASTEMRA